MDASMGPQADATYTALHQLMGHSAVIWQHQGFLDKRAQGAFGKIRAREGGNTNAEVQAPKVAARHALVLDLMREIEAANPTLTREDIATKIESRLPADNRLGRGQILRIMRGPKKRSTGDRLTSTG